MILDTLKTLFQTLFRLFPFPTETGLREVGSPGPVAPVFVTCNFDLTVRRVLGALQGLDCYLLVAPSQGINVWCAAGGGKLNADSVTSVVKTSRIADRVTHRTLILPQLSAPGIDVTKVERETGWHCVFGPVYAVDIPEYVASNLQKTGDMRRVGFPLGDRLEMAAMWAGMLTAIVLIPVVIVNWRLLPGVLALVWGFALFLFVFYEQVYRFVPGPMRLVKVVFLGVIGVIGVTTYGLTIGHWSSGMIAGWGLAILVVAVVLGFDLDGTSPLQAGATVAYYAHRWPGIMKLWTLIGYDLEMPFALSVDPGLCRGCKTCVEVCPKAVFELYRLNGGQRSSIARPKDCVQCTACVKQCPEAAILADPPIKVFESFEV
jgi:NAD-dependent dihydropyrimidine dehydrogenase PreA subunit